MTCPPIRGTRCGGGHVPECWGHVVAGDTLMLEIQAQNMSPDSRGTCPASRFRIMSRMQYPRRGLQHVRDVSGMAINDSYIGAPVGLARST